MPLSSFESIRTRGPAWQSPRQPEPTTSTDSPRPASVAAFLKASFTAAAPVERQPAAVQTQTRCFVSA